MKIVGFLLAGIPILIIFVASCSAWGWKTGLLIWLNAIILAGAIASGIYLIVNG